MKSTKVLRVGWTTEIYFIEPRFLWSEIFLALLA